MAESTLANLDCYSVRLLFDAESAQGDELGYEDAFLPDADFELQVSASS